MKKVVHFMVVLLAGLLFTAGLFAAGEKEAKVAEGVTIKVINQERWAPYVEKAVEKWNAANPDKKVVLDQLVLGYPQLRQKIATAAAGGMAPDFSLIDSVWVAEFANAGFLMPLDEIDPTWVENDYNKDFYPVFVEGDSFDGQPYGIHSQTDMALIWYRKDWFSSEGIKAPETWEELVRAVQHFQQPQVRRKYGMGEYAFAFPAGLKAAETVTYQLTPFIWSNGGDVFRNNTVVLNSSTTVAAIKLLSDFVNMYKAVSPECIAYEWNTALKLMGTGQVALSVGGSYEGSMIKEAAGWDDATFREKVGFVPIPAGPNGEQATTAGGMAYAIYRQSKNPELALEILKLTTGPELMYEFCASTGQNPPRISVVNKLDQQKDWLLVETSDMLYNARVRPIIPEYAKVSEQLQRMVENAVSGKATPEEAVAEAAKNISVITGLPLK
ncbi:MAG: hypothetical protein DRP87_00425 [Spirochaetes bacterium]|nr:MAG: hypothetical protein DRP87_00425 [Spirochaetota bacterium]